jgi:hypothetical protein
LYLGTYSYVTNVTSPEERSNRLARLDGFEVFGYVAGKEHRCTQLKIQWGGGLTFLPKALEGVFGFWIKLPWVGYYFAI